MDYDRIIGLLDKYWKCETTLPEEEELRYFYKHCRQMPEELAEYRELFIFQEGERQIGLGNDFDRKILASIYNKRPAGWRKGLRVAAVLLLLIGVSQVLIDIGNPQKDTCQTPEQALAEVRQALNFVSSKMNRGQQLLEENMDEMKKWICIGLFLIGTCSVQAQDLVSDFLAKTKENKVFTQVNISSRMFQMISEITDAETESIIRNLTGMKMLTTEQETDRYFQEVRTMLQKRKPEYEELMSILEEGEQVWMYVREKNKEIVELVILVGGKEEFMLMSFCGVIDLKKISRLAKAVNVEGMEYLGKVKK